jgi:hypothetical protein
MNVVARDPVSPVTARGASSCVVLNDATSWKEFTVNGCVTGLELRSAELDKQIIVLGPTWSEPRATIDQDA